MSVESDILQQVELTNKFLAEIVKQLHAIEKELHTMNLENQTKRQ